MIDRWGYVGEGDRQQIVVEGHVSSITMTCEMRRGDYAANVIKSTMEVRPDNLKCDVVIDKPIPEIKESKGDAGIVGQVVRRLQGELSRTVHQGMVDHLRVIHGYGQEKDDHPVRVEAGKEVKREPAREVF